MIPLHPPLNGFKVFLAIPEFYLYLRKSYPQHLPSSHLFIIALYIIIAYKRRLSAAPLQAPAWRRRRPERGAESRLLKEVSLFLGTYGVPEAISIAVVTALHFWKRAMLLSIAGGTAAYMLLVQFVF
ncbi:branched-chain amino acid transporter permease [Cloacibacillus porcorum]|uniref:branched-chain amino acid transporter permease n=1 Tax=Cloacibacillus porcorum TaxID=1197717 RepID=UPI000A04C053|nr:AzlD domain-containing protein [Cloacibacillus porcorum]MDY5390420.1 AzlD domain-containing protein [Cloacibacillus porcorum]NMF19306.1 hypothetical protein [Cloacibacillus porcorum]